MAISAVQYDVYSKALLALFQLYAWRTISVVYETEPEQPFYQQLAAAFIDFMHRSSDRLSVLTYPVQSTGYDFNSILQLIKGSTRSQ